ncbi:MAG: hypothetical protein AB1810_15460 [Pseudomonadota bacterium]
MTRTLIKLGLVGGCISVMTSHPPTSLWSILALLFLMQLTWSLLGLLPALVLPVLVFALYHVDIDSTETLPGMISPLLLICSLAILIIYFAYRLLKRATNT